MSQINYHFEVIPGDFSHAGEASTQFKKKLKKMQIPPAVIRRITIAMYEGEINMVIHANGGVIDAGIDPDEVTLVLADEGPGIEDIDQAMQEGFSTASPDARSLGFGAGMGLPNMKKSSDTIHIESKKDVGTTVTMTFRLS